MATDNNNPTRTPQEYELLSGGGAESAEMSRQGLSRRQVLRRVVGAGVALVGAEALGLGLIYIYPGLTVGFGGKITLKSKDQYPAAIPAEFDIDNGKGVFYESLAKSYIVHLAPETPWLLSGAALAAVQESENIVKDKDGSYWLAIYQRCVHLGCKFNYKTDCRSFKCPCHGSHYNADGEWLSGPAPRSNDRFEIDVSSDSVVVNTGKLNNTVQHPSPETKLLDELAIQFGCQ
jgi:cytochrome b6-f complex iron-sulfur subunit